MRYRLTEKDCLRIESWARKTNLHAILTFIESKPRRLEFVRPVLVGSNGNNDILIEGLATRSTVSSVVRHLDEPFNPNCPYTHTHVFKKQQMDLGAEVYGTIAAHNRRGAGKVCFLEHTGECQAGIVRAHLIQEALLRRMSVNGHVLEFKRFGRHDPKEEFRNWPQEVGVDDVTTFTGFCGHHDHQVFQPIEGSRFSMTPEALFLYGYRALCSSLYTCQYQFEMIKATKSAVDAKQKRSDTNLMSDIRANDSNTRDLLEIKTEWDQQLAARAFDRLDHLVLGFPKIPDVAGSMFFAPSKGFGGDLVQDTRKRGPLSWVSFSVLPRAEGGGVVIISGTKGDFVWRDYADSLLAYPPDKRTTAVFNFVICVFGEHLVLSPTWWTKLSRDAQEAVVNAWAAGYYPRHLKGHCDWGPLTPLP